LITGIRVSRIPAQVSRGTGKQISHIPPPYKAKATASKFLSHSFRCWSRPLNCPSECNSTFPANNIIILSVANLACSWLVSHNSQRNVASPLSAHRKRFLKYHRCPHNQPLPFTTLHKFSIEPDATTTPYTKVSFVGSPEIQHSRRFQSRIINDF
jgi:hypothetical protein